MILKEQIAKEVIKDLIEYDNCKKELLLREDEIKVLDNIIAEKNKIIEEQSKIKPIKEKAKLSMNAGLMFSKFKPNNFTLFTSVSIDYKKLSIGSYLKYESDNTNGYGLITSYKIF